MFITQEMLDEQLALLIPLRQPANAANLVKGWDACRAFLRSKGEIHRHVVAKQPDGICLGEPVVRIEIPAE